MKLVISALALVAFLLIANAPVPAIAQGDVRTTCSNKYGLGKRWSSASETERKDAAAKIAACIKSGGKS